MPPPPAKSEVTASRSEEKSPGSAQPGGTAAGLRYHSQLLRRLNRPTLPPLNPRTQKFHLAWRSSIDPVAFLAAGVFAGIEQATNTFPGYGQGAQGYAKRYGANYADSFIDTMIGGAILPSLLKQDPRYFYKGTGTTRSRILYAIANSVICKVATTAGGSRTILESSGASLPAASPTSTTRPATATVFSFLTFENMGLGTSPAAQSKTSFRSS